ncbi:peptidase E [Candidatus Dependentiae bacterium]|nr:peptidase E [Candidatus Dependentiae bacterium]
MSTKTIIAIGGAGFSRVGFAVERYLLEQTGKQNPKVLFIPTASGDGPYYITLFYETFNQLPCIPRHLSLFSLPKNIDLERFVLEHDLIYVGGGNTKNMLALWRMWGLDLILRKAWEKGIVLSGTSAGSLCWFEQGITDSLPHKLTVLECLGFLPGSNCPHYNDESDRRPLYHEYLLSGEICSGVAQDQSVLLHYRETSLYKVVSTKFSQRAYDVKCLNGSILESQIEPGLLE